MIDYLRSIDNFDNIIPIVIDKNKIYVLTDLTKSGQGCTLEELDEEVLEKKKK